MKTKPTLSLLILSLCQADSLAYEPAICRQGPSYILVMDSASREKYGAEAEKWDDTIAVDLFDNTFEVGYGVDIVSFRLEIP